MVIKFIIIRFLVHRWQFDLVCVSDRDFPNGWAPLQHIIVEGLTRSGSSEARSLAQDIARRWIRTNYVVYKKTGAMYEKYDVEKCGQYGGGGEYVSQVRQLSIFENGSFVSYISISAFQQWTWTENISFRDAKELGCCHITVPFNFFGLMQTGFGWSNGVVLAFLEEFGWPKDLKMDC